MPLRFWCSLTVTLQARHSALAKFMLALCVRPCSVYTSMSLYGNVTGMQGNDIVDEVRYRVYTVDMMYMY